ncbi:AP endonuclease [Scheffersomyces xylosifermentans]|uniref:AP endonuclease n=1 Tax=Scheffersomyces xylosifermentans TaxID=1304137 RepID=UPI00315D4303
MSKVDVSKLKEQDPLNKIAPKKYGDSTIRYVTFNVNGVKTLFNYHPWNKFNQDYNLLFNTLQADIITLQELKLTASTLSSIKNIGHLPNFKSFISVPKVKRGYSGVGLFVRIPDENASPKVRRNLQVIKAEEGLTGYLPSAKSATLSYRDLPSDMSIGGYDTDIDETTGLELDSEGRCVVIELACNLVVFALYCPANSMGTEEGEQFRIKFLRSLFKRCYNLKFKLGKEVLVMGDINVCLDLIDSAEGMSDRQKQNLIQPTSDGLSFETVNYEECNNFKKSTAGRSILNQYTIPGMQHSLLVNHNLNSIGNEPFLFDTTRYVQGRRMNMYTVWNTMTSARAVNYGSRIDLILISCPSMVQSISNSDIWPFILGSDHCPVFTDFDVEEVEELIGETSTKSTSTPVPAKLDFEAKYYYKLSQAVDISALFSRKRSPTENSESSSSSQSCIKTDIDAKRSKVETVPSKPKLKYVSRKLPNKADGQRGINSFFGSNASEN